MKNTIQSGVVGWRSPSNIALVKYWGKYGNQLPRNASVSFTLQNAITETIIQYESLDYESDHPTIDFYFEGKPNEAFQLKIKSFLEKNIEYFLELRKYHLSIESRNSFPHSSGIASSASSMSALALCLCEIQQMQNPEQQTIFLQKASYRSRLASGSACRSIYPHVAMWGNAKGINNSSEEYAVPISGIHEVFTTFHDDILIVSEKEKSVSSTAGHALMNQNVYADNRYQQANENTLKCIDFLRDGDVWNLGQLMEEEAMTLHALMMCSRPSYVLMEPETLQIINHLKTFRNDTKIPAFFSLDAGPNVHLLYPHEYESQVQDFITSTLAQYCQNNRVIKDRVGLGPQKIEGFSI